MRNIIALAITTFRESVRSKILYTVFFFTLAILYRMSRQIDDIMEAIAQGKARSAEQVAKEDAEYEGRFKDDNIDSNEDNKDN